MVNNVLSFGGGVQSSALYLMGVRGEIQIDYAVFADTGCELPATLSWIEKIKSNKIPIYRVSGGDLIQDVKDILEKGRAGGLPLWMKDEAGKISPMNRDCTRKFKLRPIRRKIQKIREKSPVNMIIGISFDELERMRTSDVKFITNSYPLVMSYKTREDCKRYLLDAVGEVPPRSSCVVCPYHNESYWRYLKGSHPKEFKIACDLDNLIRNPKKIKSPCYLYSKGIPLNEADFSVNNSQLDFGFKNECLGMCGN